MLNQFATLEPAAAIQLTGAVCQMATALIAGVIGMITFRYTRRQSALALINENNSLANQVNMAVLQSEQARQTLGKLDNCIVGCPDDAILFMYLNYVHNTFRMHEIGAVSAQVWEDTLLSCASMLRRLQYHQVEDLLSRGYERAFQIEVLRRYNEAAARECDTFSPPRQWTAERPHLTLVR